MRKLSLVGISILILGSISLRNIENVSILNPMETLGWHLFFDRQLSANLTKSCSSCHDPKLAFTDGYHRSTGIYGDLVLHNAPTLINVKERISLTWTNDTLHKLVDQMDNPLFAIHPTELGWLGNEEKIISRFKKDKQYYKLFKKAFPGVKDPFQILYFKTAIAAYEAKIISKNTAYDRYKFQGDSSAITAQQKAGEKLFFGEKYQCGVCHNGVNFDEPSRGSYFANIGLYNCDSGYPAYDQGLYVYSKDTDDIGRFRIPTLRNIAITAPYYHDGSANNLTEIISAYAHGGRKVNYGDYQGDGSMNPNLDGRIDTFAMIDHEVVELISFLHALTDSSIFSNPIFQNPFQD